MRLDYYLVNCTKVAVTGSCSGGVIGPLNTQYFPAKAISNGPITLQASPMQTLGCHELCQGGL